MVIFLHGIYLDVVPIFTTHVEICLGMANHLALYGLMYHLALFKGAAVNNVYRTFDEVHGVGHMRWSNLRRYALFMMKKYGDFAAIALGSLVGYAIVALEYTRAGGTGSSFRSTSAMVAYTAFAPAVFRQLQAGYQAVAYKLRLLKWQYNW